MYYYGYSFGISIHQRGKVEILVDEVYTVIILADRACEREMIAGIVIIRLRWMLLPLKTAGILVMKTRQKPF